MLMLDFVRCMLLMQNNLTTSEMAASMNVSKPVMLDMLTFLKENNFTVEQAIALGNGQLNKMYRGIPPPDSRQQFFQPDFNHIHKELAKKEVTLESLWNQYKNAAFENGMSNYSYSRFCALYRRWSAVSKVVMRIQHKPGDAVEVDWSGVKPLYYHEASQSYREAHVFIAALPYSLDFFFDVFEDEKMESWLKAHVNAFEYFGGVPRLIKPDNLKTGVTKHERLERALNPAYVEMCDYYGIAIVPTRVRKPRDKSHAEGTVSIVERQIIAPLRGKKFDCLARLKEEMQIKRDEVMSKTVDVLGCTRREYYLREEKEFMRPLPIEPFETVIWSKQKVPNDYMIKAGLNRYSVPCKLYGKTVNIRQTSSLVEVFYNLEKVASHVFVKELQRFPIILEEHMPRNHREYLHYTREDFLKFAGTVGPATKSFFQLMMDRSKAPEQVYPDCASLKSLAEKYGNQNLESACNAVLATGKVDVKQIDKYVKNPDTIPRTAPNQTEVIQEVHHNVPGMTRGASQFQSIKK